MGAEGSSTRDEDEDEYLGEQDEEDEEEAGTFEAG